MRIVELIKEEIKYNKNFMLNSSFSGEDQNMLHFLDENYIISWLALIAYIFEEERTKWERLKTGL